jgi:uncharacterized membrane protein YfcA
MTGSDPTLDLATIAVIFAALALGGLMKGATGAGAPVIAVPVMAAFFDVRFAVVIMAAPSLVMNIWQLWHFRNSHLPDRFPLRLGLAGAAGTVAGTALLATLPVEALSLVIAGTIVAYIALRLARPGFRVPWDVARRAVLPVGALAGVLQGAAGLSAPVSVGFLNAMRLERAAFIATISALFAAMGMAQLPALAGFGLLTPHLLALSAAALIPLVAFMPVGSWLARRISPRSFDRLVLALLTVLALRLVYDTVA